MRYSLAVFALLILLGVSSHTAAANDRSELRLYKINKHGQSSRLRFTSKKSKLEGCQNLIKASRIHRVVQFGFQWCVVYSEKDCPESASLYLKQGDDKEAFTKLAQGYSWYLGAEPKDEKFPKYSKKERGQKVKSWQCQATD